MAYESPKDFLKSLLEDKTHKEIIENISEGKEPEEMLESIIGDQDD